MALPKEDRDRLVRLLDRLMAGVVPAGARAKVKERLADLVTPDQAADILGLKTVSVYYHIRTGNLPAMSDGTTTVLFAPDVEALRDSLAGTRKAREDRNRAILRMFDAGTTQAEIARQLKVTDETVRVVLLKGKAEAAPVPA